MFCPKCGQPYADGMRFCEHCGAPLPQGPGGPGGPQASASRQAFAAQMSGNPVMDLLRRLATSPLYLAGAIGYSCMILFQLVAAMSGNSLTRAVDQYLSLMLRYGNLGIGELGDVADQLYGILPMMRGVSLGAALIGQLPSIVVAIGMWMLFASAMDHSGQPMKATGLTLIRVIAILQIVLVSLAALGAVVILLILMAALARYDDAAVPAFLIVIVLVAAIFALGILFYVKLAGTIQTMRNSILTGMASDRVSAYVAVISIIGGVCALFGLLGAGGLSNVLAIVASVVAAFSYGIFLFKYRDAMRMAMAGQFVGATACPQSPCSAPEPPCAVQYARPEPPRPEPQPTYDEVSPRTQEQPTTPIPAASSFVPETTVLNAPSRQPNLQIIHVRDGSSVSITQQRFRIGRDPAAVDYIINDNTAVGRQHADILIHDGACYVVDLNSTNHTYLNGEPLTPGTEYPLQDGDEILLGNEAFRVSLS